MTALPFTIRRTDEAIEAGRVTQTKETVHGLLRIVDEGLRVEWRVWRETARVGQDIRRDREAGPVRTTSVPLARIAGARVRGARWPWPFRPRLVLTAADLEAFEKIAGEEGLALAHPAELVLMLRRDHALIAEEFAAELALAIAEAGDSADRSIGPSREAALPAVDTPARGSLGPSTSIAIAAFACVLAGTAAVPYVPPVAGQSPGVVATDAAGPVPAAGSQQAQVRHSPDVPFEVGERFEYRMQAKWFLVRGNGTARFEVEGIDTIRGQPSYRLAMAMKGGITVFHMDDVSRSWLDVDELFARRFHQITDQTTYQRNRIYEFFPDSMRYRQYDFDKDSARFVERNRKGHELASARPLDDVSFLYHVRTLALTVGREISESRYYKKEGNPASVRVLRTERIRVPAGEFDAIVVKPTIKSGGLFGEEGEAVIWLTNDDLHMPLKLQAKVSIATLTMELTSYTLPSGDR